VSETFKRRVASRPADTVEENIRQAHGGESRLCFAKSS
jgi:hypothetical protein